MFVRFSRGCQLDRLVACFFAFNRDFLFESNAMTNAKTADKCYIWNLTKRKLILFPIVITIAFACGIRSVHTCSHLIFSHSCYLLQPTARIHAHKM